jgi:CRP/FNR family transcriptional regulator, cyclic AMP receptor protein
MAASLRRRRLQNGQVPDISAFLPALQASLPGLAAPPAARAARLPPPRRKRLAAHQTLFAQGQTVQQFFLLAQGALSLEVGTVDGQGSALDRVQAPALFGLSAFITGRPSRFEARALQSSHVWPIGEALFSALMDGWPGFARALMRRLAEHFDGNLGLLSSARHQSLGERVRHALNQLPATRRTDGWQEACISQVELARLAGVSRQGVNAWLRAARRNGEVELGYRRLRWRN